MILGIDEVGRGSWAGPLVVGAVVLGGVEIDGLTDSKKLTKKRREELDIIIREKAIGYGLGWVTASEIDEIGLSESLKLATIRAVEKIRAPYTEIIIDGTVNFLAATGKGKYVKTIPKADLLIPSVSAASIIAKVARDKYMSELGDDTEKYGFRSHVGYGTKKHEMAINEHGVSKYHRMSFKPISKIFGKQAIKTSKDIGYQGEEMARKHLIKQGYKIIESNWHNKWCEIDIVAEKNKSLYFIEVKYRKNDKYGDGLVYVNHKKQKQMKFAAEYYIDTQKASQKYDNFYLLAISLSGEDYKVNELLELR